MSKKNRWERAWIQKKINSGVKQEELRTSIGIFSNRKKKKVMEQKGLSEKQYKKRYDFLGNCYVLLNNERFKPKAKQEKKQERDGYIPRTERSAFRSRDYTKAELNALVDDINSINF